jgi:hypothetical protein
MIFFKFYYRLTKGVGLFLLLLKIFLEDLRKEEQSKSAIYRSLLQAVSGKGCSVAAYS